MNHIRPSSIRLAALTIGAVIALLSPSLARAESGRFNLHLSGLGPLPSAAEATFDWQLAPPFALEARVGGGVVTDFGQQIDGIFYFSVGGRFRFFDDESGYLDEGGSIAGHLWFGPHVGLFVAGEGPRIGGFLFDLSVGYDFSIVKPVSIGPFLRGGLGIGDVLAPFFAGGIQVSIEFDPIRHPRSDTDVDGVYDEDDACPATPTGQSVNAVGCGDTDGDGVYDDTDACPGTPAGQAVNAIGCGDMDGDGVYDDADVCPGTPPGSDVDARGCIVLPPQLVLDGIAFEFGSAEILPSSEQTLSGAAQALVDNPRVRIEIGGHTDDIGTDAANRELSLARATSVRDWLVAHGVEIARFEVRGYGASEPRVPNTDDAARAMNRRIEFRQLED